MAMERIEFAFRSPGKLFTRAVIFLLLLLCTGYVLTIFAPGFMVRYFALETSSVLQGKVWQLVTYHFVTGCPWNLIFAVLTVLFVGSAVEKDLGTAGLLLFWAVIGLICGLLWMLINLITGQNFIGGGPVAGTCALICMMGILFKESRILFFFFPLKAEHLAILLITIVVILNIYPPINLIWILGAPAAWYYYKLRRKALAGRSKRFSSKTNSKKEGFVDID